MITFDLEYKPLYINGAKQKDFLATAAIWWSQEGELSTQVPRSQTTLSFWSGVLAILYTEG